LSELNAHSSHFATVCRRLGDETSDEVPRLGTLEFTLHKVNGHKMKATQFGDTAQQNDEGVSGHKKEAENHFLVY
jgi:hypothetical protein